MKDSISNMHREMSSATTRLLSGQKQVQCPDVSKATGCVSPMLFISLVVVQLVIIMAFLIYRYFLYKRNTPSPGLGLNAPSYNGIVIKYSSN